MPGGDETVTRRRALLSWSSGKDSAWALERARDAGISAAAFGDLFLIDGAR